MEPPPPPAEDTDPFLQLTSKLPPSTETDHEIRKRIWNKNVFALNPDLTVDKEPSQTSKHLTPKAYADICTVLRNWGPKDSDGNYLAVTRINDLELRDQTKAYRGQNQNKYKWAKNFRLESYIDSNGDSKERLKRIESAWNDARTVVPMNQVFDILSDAHSATISHAGRDTTYGNIRRKFYNVTQADVAAFIDTCPICISRRQRTEAEIADDRRKKRESDKRKKEVILGEAAAELGVKRKRLKPEKKKTIVISGVTSGLGRGLLEYYYLQGHLVAGCARTKQDVKTLQKMFPEARLSVVDVTSDMAVATWADDLCGKLGADRTENAQHLEVDIVIANAGVSPETALENRAAWEVPCVDFDATLDTNIKGVANMIRHFIPKMIDDTKNQSCENTKCFVAISSGLGRSPNPYHAAYCASKFAIEGMIKSLAMSLSAPFCAVPIAPGIVETAMMPGNGGDNTVKNWVKKAGPLILGLDRKDNGKSLSVDGFYTQKYKDTWIIKDGVGIPEELGHDFSSMTTSKNNE